MRENKQADPNKQNIFLIKLSYLEEICIDKNFPFESRIL